MNTLSKRPIASRVSGELVEPEMNDNNSPRAAVREASSAGGLTRRRKASSFAPSAL